VNAVLFVNDEGQPDFRTMFMIYSFPVVTLYVMYSIVKTAL
jgi:hypothetical protein